MDDLYFYNKLINNIRERQKSLEESLCFGPVPDFTAFKELRGRLAELAITEQVLRDLLKKVSDE
jgi:hypothetical protein|tara:strand:- start:1480 stop:1671 length:192 start_codon:yes stop_codon:yes gene_type:complete